MYLYTKNIWNFSLIFETVTTKTTKNANSCFEGTCFFHLHIIIVFYPEDSRFFRKGSKFVPDSMTPLPKAHYSTLKTSF